MFFLSSAGPRLTMVKERDVLLALLLRLLLAPLAGSKLKGPIIGQVATGKGYDWLNWT